ncbi:hypothetical protein DPMN_029171 [Dreissena polymorpha]|uniref:RRM domain-containing protein n=1 Tax=Dreissena polymorpha TaxID=45954 RepID=A0A9D4RGV2_DREPO|nr:hypothetical protein DPMN_029171 [Dreissena polymorpha]
MCDSRFGRYFARNDGDNEEGGKRRSSQGKRKRGDHAYGDDSVRFRKLFIGGLSYTTTNESFKEYFEQWGR